MKLYLEKLGTKELKDLFLAVRDERDRRSKKNPANHQAPTWIVPKDALTEPKNGSSVTASSLND